MARVIEEFKDLFQEFRLDSLVHLPQVYAEEVVFVDPLHRIEGVAALEQYFAASMRGMTACRFEFGRQIMGGREASLEWRMIYRHPRLRRGRELMLHGVSLLEFDAKIHYHRDYYDAGQMLYEHIPVMGAVIAYLKRKIAS